MKTPTIDECLAEIAISLDHLGHGIRQLNQINKQQPVNADSLEEIDMLETALSHWLSKMEDAYMELQQDD